MDERTARREPPPPEGDLLAPGLVHELRQPLTGLDAGLRLVARELGPAVTGLDGWKMATSQLARARETLETYQQLLTPGRAGHGPFAVVPVVRCAVDALRHRLEGLQGRFAVVVEHEVPQAHGSAQALYHAVTNLIANAIDAVAEAGAEGRVEVRVLRAPGDDTRPQVRVADDGAGIPAAARRRLFTPRFTTKPHGKGTGLGLAISRRMLRAAGGEVRLARAEEAARHPWARTELVVDLAASASAPAPREPAPAGEGRAAGALRASMAAVLLAGCVGIGWAGFHRWVRAGEEPGSTPAVSVPSERVEIVDAEGRLERLRDGAWEPLPKGATLREDDTLRTGAGARATIAIGDRSRLVVSDATQLTVREVTAAVQRLRLSRGRLSVDHQADGARVLVIESERGDATARAGTARFSVLANGAALAVATETGIVRLQAADRTVDVGAGKQSIALRGQAPAPATPVSVDLLLRVARSARGSDGTCTVEGSVEPGAEVRVDGRDVEAAPDGHFAVRVPAHAGATYASVVTRDASGRTVQRRVPCARDLSEHDLSDFAVRWGQHDSTPQRRR
jgi:hypothetical protein